MRGVIFGLLILIVSLTVFSVACGGNCGSNQDTETQNPNASIYDSLSKMWFLTARMQIDSLNGSLDVEKQESVLEYNRYVTSQVEWILPNLEKAEELAREAKNYIAATNLGWLRDVLQRDVLSAIKDNDYRLARHYLTFAREFYAYQDLLSWARE